MIGDVPENIKSLFDENRVLWVPDGVMVKPSDNAVFADSPDDVTVNTTSGNPATVVEVFGLLLF